MLNGSEAVVEEADHLTTATTTAVESSSTPAAVDYVAWSARTSHGLRTAAEDIDAALRRSRVEVLRTVAALRARDDEFGGAAASRPAAGPPQLTSAHLSRGGPRKSLYPHRDTGHYKTMADLTAAERRRSRTGQPDAVTASTAVGEAAVVRSDPRGAVAAKHRAAVEAVKPQVPLRVVESLQRHARSLGTVKPYGLSRRTRQESSGLVVQSTMESNERYVDRMQCCRPSKGLFVYYE